MRAGAAAAPARPQAARRGQPAAWLLAAFAWLCLVWNLPVETAGLEPRRLGVAFEVVLLFALLALAPPLRRGRTGLAVACAVGLATALVLVLQLADLAIRTSLARPLNPLLDLHLAPSLVHLLTGTLGAALGGLALGGPRRAPAARLRPDGRGGPDHPARARGARRAPRGARGRGRRGRAAGGGALRAAGFRGVAPGVAARQREPGRALAAGRGDAGRARRVRSPGARGPLPGAAGRRPARRAGWRRRAADVHRVLWPQRARAGALCRDPGAEARGLRAGARGSRARGRLGLAHLADRRRAILARPRHARERALDQRPAPLRPPGDRRPPDAHQGVRPGRLPRDRGQAGDHHALAGGREPRLRAGLRRRRSRLRGPALQLGDHARPVHAERARAARARPPRPAAVRRGVADQQPRALDADPAGARRLVGDRRWGGVLALGRDRRSAGGGVARSRAGAPPVHAGARLCPVACSRPTPGISSTTVRS